MAAHQAPSSLGFSRKEYWGGLPFPSPMHEKRKGKLKSLSHVWLLATPWTAAYQAPPSMGFSRQEYWSGVPLHSPADDISMKKKKNCKASCLNVITTRKSYALDQDYWLLATWKKQVPQIRKRDSYLRFTIPSTCTTSIFGVSLSLSPVHRDLEFIGFNPNLIKFTIDISLGLLCTWLSLCIQNISEIYKIYKKVTWSINIGNCWEGGCFGFL